MLYHRLRGGCMSKFEKMEKENINGKKVNLFKLVPIDDEITIIKTIFQKFLEYKSQTQVESYLIQNDYSYLYNFEFYVQSPIYFYCCKKIISFVFN